MPERGCCTASAGSTASPNYAPITLSSDEMRFRIGDRRDLDAHCEVAP
jgi:hypothetical protein